MFLFILALCLLAAAAAFCALMAVRRPSRAVGRAANLAGACGAGAACLTGLCAVGAGPWSAALSLQLPLGLPVGACVLGLDALSRLFLLPVFGLGLACAAAGGLALRHENPKHHNLGAHWFFFLMLLLGLALVMAARDAVLFLLAWELMSLAPFFLIDFNDGDSQVRDASWIYLVAAHLGAVALLAFFALLWQVSGSTLLLPGEGLPLTPGQAGPGTLTALFVLAVLGFGAKAGLAPLHIWLPEAHPAAPSHVSALLSGAMINAGLYGLMRVPGLLAPAGAAPEWWGWTLLLLGLTTGLMSILKAAAQSNLKRLLAYSSVENMGLMVLGLGAGLVGQANGNAWIAVLGCAGALLHMSNHAAFKGLLFLCAGEVLHAAGTVRMPLLGGLQRRLPLLGAAFAAGAAAIACLPPFNGFTGELALALSLLDAPALNGVERQMGLLLALAGLAAISGLAAALYAKAYGITFLGEPRSPFAAAAHPASWRTLWPLALPAAVCCGGGLAGPWLLDLAAAAAQAALPLPPHLADAGRADLAQARQSLVAVAQVGGAGLVLVLLLLLTRRLLLKKRVTASVPTWGCGFQDASPRIQYTDAGFTEPTARIFAPVMGLKVRLELDSGLFPQPGELHVSAPDRLRSGLFAPLFAAVERLCNACKVIQHGKIHLYILYILAALVGLLVWGLRS
ncbi:proton-conducting transporter transmembrane domain-containing protein [Desulfovibrio legallii]|uniref:NADH:quinone oxidoreductase/Mrp antiporter transmembrane domain-containing protein n=1 Tax=Desulfovibrio legallii TaxID=571438 RepID=A0A1G7MRS0_9BACT|nr:proton-conducting transporter membrane subunit [Desulfovibrio legallii]SDF63760.1 hypothetical protein/hydrogenase-4 component B [Desulfovibrio legallii]